MPLLVIKHHLAARGSSLIGALAAHCDAEFLDRIERNRQHGVEPGVGVRAIPVDALVGVAGGGVLRDQAGVLVVVHVHAIQGDVILIAARPQDLSIRGDTRLQAEQLDYVPGLEWKFADLHFRKCVPNRSVHCVDCGSLRRHVDGFGGLAEFHAEIECRRRIHEQLYVRAS